MSEAKKTTEKNDKKAVEIKPGMTVKVHEKIREKNAKGEEKERTQIFEGIVLAHKHNKEAGATITVRKVSGGIGVEHNTTFGKSVFPGVSGEHNILLAPDILFTSLSSIFWEFTKNV